MLWKKEIMILIYLLLFSHKIYKINNLTSKLFALLSKFKLVYP